MSLLYKSSITSHKSPEVTSGHCEDLIDSMNTRQPRILICFTGSVSTVKIPEIYVRLSEFAIVRMVASSEASMFFLGISESYNSDIWEEFVEKGGKEAVIPEIAEWSAFKKVGDPVLHIELR